MEAEFSLDIDDIVAYVLYHYSHSPKIKQQLKIRRITYGILSGLFLLSLVFFIALIFIRSTGIEKNDLPMIYILVIIFFFLLRYFFLRTTRKRVTKEVTKRYGDGENDVIGNHKFIIGEKQMTDITKMGVSTASWAVIEEIIFTHNYLYMIKRASSEAYVVPKKAFADDKSFSQFAETAKKYHQVVLAKPQAA